MEKEKITNILIKMTTYEEVKAWCDSHAISHGKEYDELMEWINYNIQYFDTMAHVIYPIINRHELFE